MNQEDKELSICATCGTQYDFTIDTAPAICRMCEDPRQFVPPAGQTWTNLAQVNKAHKNEIRQDDVDGRIWSIFSAPQFGIGQRAIFLETPSGNILWDCIANLDEDTIKFIESKGGVKAMAISHPHFYTSHLTWSKQFNCPVYLAAEDQLWLNRKDPENRRIFIQEPTKEILPGVTAVKLGGHFPGSMVLHWDDKIFTGDTIGISLSALHAPRLTKRQPGSQTFFFQWAFPNFIPLGPDAMHNMWLRLKPWNFHTVHSLFFSTHVRDPSAKSLMLESMKIQARHMDHAGHPLNQEIWN